MSGQKTTPKYGVVTKAEIDTLFERLRYLYEDLYTPIPRIALPFPLQLVARVRVWRGQTVPDAGRFLKAVESVARNGMSPVEVETLVMVNETLFRPMRAVELELEAQDWTAKFFGWARTEISPVARLQFRQLWQETAAEVGEEWYLAARRRPLSISGKPALIAPKITGAVIARRLQDEGIQESSALNAGAVLEAVLMGRQLLPADIPVAARKVKHWRDVFGGVQVPRSEGGMSLTRYLAYPLEIVQQKKWISGGRFQSAWTTPTDVLTEWVLPIATCADFAGLFWRRGPDTLAACQLCDTEEMPLEEIWRHLETDHAIPGDVLEVPDTRPIRSLSSPWYANEIRRKEDGEAVAKWRRARHTASVQKPGPSRSDRSGRFSRS